MNPKITIWVDPDALDDVMTLLQLTLPYMTEDLVIEVDESK